MLTYFLRRVYLVIPTLFLVTVIAFLLSRLTPGDPVSRLCGDPLNSERTGFLNPEEAERQYASCAKLLGLDKPAFYVSLVPLAFPDTLYREVRKYRRAAKRKLIREYGNWSAVETYANAISSAEHALPDYKGQALIEDMVIAIRIRLRQLHINGAPERIRYAIDEIQGLSDSLVVRNDSVAVAIGFSAFQASLSLLRSAFEGMEREAARWKLLIPTIRWNGLDNQYHHWLSSALQGDLGISYQDRKPVMKKIWASARWTLLMNGLAILFAFALAIPLGGVSASQAGSRTDHTIGAILFGLYSLPAFWVATLLILFLTTPEYSPWLDWFPAGGLGQRQSDEGAFSRMGDLLWHITLPVVSLTYGSLAIIARQMRGSLVEVLRRPFIQTARAKGLHERTVVWKHGFLNALFPIITLIGSVVPALLAGSVIIEYIFSIPGMGQLTYQSIVSEDWPVVFGILFLAALLTMLGNLLADVLYAFVDPRVTFQNNRP